MNLFPTEVSVFLSYTAGFALMGLISFYLIAKIIDVLKIDQPWKSLILFPLVVALILYLMLFLPNIFNESHNRLDPHFLVAIVGFPLGWFTALAVFYFITTLKGKE